MSEEKTEESVKKTVGSKEGPASIPTKVLAKADAKLVEQIEAEMMVEDVDMDEVFKLGEEE